MLDKIGNKVNSYFSGIDADLLQLGVCQIIREKGNIYPATYINGGLVNLIADSKIAEYYSFVRIQDEYTFKNDVFKGDISITFFCNVGKQGKTIESLRTEIIAAAQIGFNEYEITISEDPNNVYNGFNSMIEHKQFNMSPYYVVKVSIPNYSTQC